jgi:hypothetical protein
VVGAMVEVVNNFCYAVIIRIFILADREVVVQKENKNHEDITIWIAIKSNLFLISSYHLSFASKKESAAHPPSH